MPSLRDLYNRGVVEVVDDNTSLGSGFEALRFSGVGVDLTDAGDKTAIVNITGGGGGSGGTSLGTTLTTFSGTTDPIDDGSGVLLNLNASPVMLIARVSADKPCKIRGYNSSDARTADTPRSSNIPPTDTIEGLVFEVELTQDNLEYDLSFNVPYINLDDPQQNELYINAFNLSGSNSTLFISVDAVVSGSGGGSSVGTTKGDLTGHDGTQAVRIPIGSPGQVLTVDLNSPGGLKWANLNGGGT